MSIHSISKCGRREQNEDCHIIIKNIDGKDKSINNVNLFAVFDGHGGKAVSKFVSNNLPQMFLNKSLQLPVSTSYVKTCFKNLQQILKTNHDDIADYAGSTCLIVLEYIFNEKRYLDVYNLGDSRMILCKKSEAHVITKDHKPNWPDEQSRIEKIGGKIYFDGYDWRIGDLSVSRAFGDLDNAPYISCKPDIFRYKISRNDKFFILACDGLWDVIDNQEAVNFILDKCYDKTTDERINKNLNIARALAEYAYNKESLDNITIIVVFLK
jgi:serine/threonine protein phosphatase PrpC